MESKKNLKILFLDIDGPIAPFCHKDEDFSIPHIPCIMPQKVEILKKILKSHPEYKIVIISDWRNNLSFDQLKETFNYFSIDILAAVPANMEKDVAIVEWLKNNEVEKFIIIDDETVFDVDHEFSFHQIKPSLHSGLLAYHIDFFDELAK